VAAVPAAPTEAGVVISAALIVGGFVAAIVGLYVLGCRVENPAVEERSRADWAGMAYNSFVEIGRTAAEATAKFLEVGAALAAAFAEVRARQQADALARYQMLDQREPRRVR
jgi:hypothetical protein